MANKTELKLRQFTIPFAMPDRPEILHVLHSMDFKASGDIWIHRVRRFLVNVVLFGMKDQLTPKLLQSSKVACTSDLYILFLIFDTE